MSPLLSLVIGIAILVLMGVQARRGKTVALKYWGKVIVSRRNEPDQYWISMFTQLACACIAFTNTLIKIF